MFIQFRVRKTSIRNLLYLEGSSGLNESHTFLVGRESVGRERRGSLLPVRDAHGTGPS